MVDVAGEDDALTRQLAVGIPQAVIHQVAQDDSVGVLVEHRIVDFLGVKVQGVGVDALVFQLSDLLI